MADTLTNAEIAGRLKEIRTLMEFAGEPFFKFMAYERAAETIENAPPLADMLAGGRLQELPGVGKSIAGRIAELCETGTCGYLEELRTRYPSTLIELLGVGGVGMKTARRSAVIKVARRSRTGNRCEHAKRPGKSRLRTSSAACWPIKAAQAPPLRIALAAGARDRGVSRGDDARRWLTRPAAAWPNEPTVGDIDRLHLGRTQGSRHAALTSWERAEAVLAEEEQSQRHLATPAVADRLCEGSTGQRLRKPTVYAFTGANTISSCANSPCERTCGSAKSGIVDLN